MLIGNRRNQNKFGHWQVLIQYGIKKPGKSLDELMAIRKAESENKLPG